MKHNLSPSRFTQEQQILRAQIVDVFKYLRKSKLNIPRTTEEVGLDTVNTYYISHSLEELTQGVDIKDYSKVFIRGCACGCSEDNEYGIEVYTTRKQTDTEYFDRICSYHIPSNYQINQYNEYLRLKKQFEG